MLTQEDNSVILGRRDAWKVLFPPYSWLKCCLVYHFWVRYLCWRSSVIHPWKAMISLVCVFQTDFPFWESIRWIKSLTTVSPKWKWASWMLLIYSCPLDWIKNSHLKMRQWEIFWHIHVRRACHCDRHTCATLETTWRVPARGRLPAPSSSVPHHSSSIWRCRHDLWGCSSRISSHQVRLGAILCYILLRFITDTSESFLSKAVFICSSLFFSCQIFSRQNGNAVKSKWHFCLNFVSDYFLVHWTFVSDI